MDIETLRNYCLQKKAATEEFPFDSSTLVFKIGGKIFLLINLDNPVKFNVKCDPEKAVILREEFDEVEPGFHMNKVHWNTVRMDGRLSRLQLEQFIDHSYDLVFKSLARKVREEII